MPWATAPTQHAPCRSAPVRRLQSCKQQGGQRRGPGVQQLHGQHDPGPCSGARVALGLGPLPEAASVPDAPGRWRWWCPGGPWLRWRPTPPPRDVASLRTPSRMSRALARPLTAQGGLQAWRWTFGPWQLRWCAPGVELKSRGLGLVFEAPLDVCQARCQGAPVLASSLTCVCEPW